MSIDQITAEQEALQSLMKLLEQAKRCQLLYQRAHMSLPEPLRRVLGMSGNGTGAAPPPSGVNIPAPPTPPAPVGVKPDWIWIPQESATPTSVLLALLRASKAPIRAKEAIAEVQEILPNVSRGTINNIASRLGGKKIDRNKDGWRLINPESSGILHERYLWGPREFFQHYELAVHRRNAILYLLGFFQSGLQSGQILEQLRNCEWVHAPMNKDLLKADLEELDKEEKIRRRGNSGKWELVPTQDAMKLDT